MTDIDRALERWLHEYLDEGYPSQSPGADMQTRSARGNTYPQKRRPPVDHGGDGSHLQQTARGTATRRASVSRPAATKWSADAARVERVMQELRELDSHAHYALMCQLRAVDCPPAAMPAQVFMAATKQTLSAYNQAVRRARLAVRVALAVM